MNIEHDILHMMKIDVLHDQLANEMMVIRTPANLTCFHVSTTTNKFATIDIILKQS
jgi:hypothetical protein